MKFCRLVFFCIVALSLLVNIEGYFNNTNAPHEQVHLSYGGTATEMIVTWITMAPNDQPMIVKYGTNKKNLEYIEIANTTLFVDPQLSCKHRFVHRATLYVEPNMKYCKFVEFNESSNN